jgi:hypothetical protein
MRIERYADECALCRKTIYVPMSIVPKDDYCGICAIHIELSAIREELECLVMRE